MTFRNELILNISKIQEWGRQTQTDAFRIYDREIPEFPLAIDTYAGRLAIQFFAKGKEELPQSLIDEVNKTLKELGFLEIYWRTRSKSKETRQYEKFSNSKEFFVAQEYGVKFWINLVDYLDTGLFLDHRETRQLAAKLAVGKRVLNLFAYTSSFSLHAAKQGALYTKSVDLSNTYTDWSRQNFILNSLSLKNNEIVRADVLRFLKEERSKYDLIIIDPPTISRSKKMSQLFDIQVDYPFLLNQSLRLLNPSGTILFSTNSRKFKFDTTQFQQATEITTIPSDFKDLKIHRTWRLTKTN